MAPPAGTRTLANVVAGMVMPLPPLLQLWAQACQVALTTTDYCSLEVGVVLWQCRGCGWPPRALRWSVAAELCRGEPLVHMAFMQTPLPC